MTPEQEEQVRRALAAAGRDGAGEEDRSVPPDVAARLDRVLAELVQDRSPSVGTPTGTPTGTPSGTPTGTPTGQADDLATRRRRKWPNALVAAAAVAVIAVAGWAVATRGLGSSGNDSSASSASSSSDSGGGAAQDRVRPESGVAPSPSDGGRFVAPVPAVRLRTATLDADVRRAAAALTSPAKNAEGAGGGSARATACATPAVPRGADVVDVRLDGQRATLVLDPPADGARVARIYSCDDASTPVATRTVPQP